jgi:tetratricopeptide (TPR) repeat protein
MRAGETVANRFALEGEIASGGMGKVFRALDRQSGAYVALKIIHPDGEADPERFQRESVVLASLTHPGIVRYVAHGMTATGEPYLAMEWLEGEDLASWLGRRSTMSVDGAITLARRIASALGELHRRGLVHRDVKPSNVFLVDGHVDRAKLLDFGVARTSSARTFTRSGALVGTPSYMAPEQARCGHEVDARADVWALGCVLYECLAGDAPFSGRQVMAVLAKILLDPAPRLRQARADVPGELDELVARMLAKDPRERPTDGNAVVDELGAVSSGTRTLVSSGAHSAIEVASLTDREQRFHCVLVARHDVSDDAEARLKRVVAPFGARLEPLSQSAVLVSLGPSHDASDDAVRTARAAFAVRHALPEVALVLASSRSAGYGHVALGALVDRAARDLASTPCGAIRIDGLTAGMLEARFEITGDSDALYLRPERDESEGGRARARSLWVGRDVELAYLEGIYGECTAEPIARAVLVTGPAGVGKSRLRQELVRRLRRRSRRATVLFARGDALGVGSPYVMLAPAIRRWAGIVDGEPLDTSRAKLREHVGRAVARDASGVAEMLGEIVGVAFDDALRPPLQSAAMRRAFEAWLAAECAAHPVILVLEDLHWGDLPTVELVDDALRALRDAPFMVLAFARSEVHAQFPNLWEDRGVKELRLEALTRKASHKLVRHALGERAAQDVVARIVERAEGNPFYLEELVRAVERDRHAAVPESVLGMLQSRLDATSLDARRVLRAASVFGLTFWRGGVAALLGGGTAAAVTAAEWIDDLVAREIIDVRATSQIRGDDELVFRHELARDAAYALLTREDRVLGHRLAGEWLERHGFREPLVLAEHFDRGADPARARECYARAAADALHASDFGAAITRAERAVTCGADGWSLGELRVLQARASRWLGLYAEARAYAEDAAAVLTTGSAAWFSAASEATIAAARRGARDVVERWVTRAADARSDPSARGAKIACMCLGAFQWILSARLDLAATQIGAIAKLVADAGDLDAETLARVEHLRAVRDAHTAGVGAFLSSLVTVIDAFEGAGELKSASGATLGWCLAELGQLEDTERILREATERCRRKDAARSATFALVNLGYSIALASKADEARRVAERPGDSSRSQRNVRLDGWARVHASASALAAGHIEEAVELAEGAVELLRVSPGLHAWALAAHARALLALGRVDEALASVRGARATREALGGILQCDSLAPLVLGEVGRDADDGDARDAFVAAATRLRERASRLAKTEWRESFVTLSSAASTTRASR